MLILSNRLEAEACDDLDGLMTVFVTGRNGL